MMGIVERIVTPVKYWWMSLILGILYIAVALSLIFEPISSYIALSVIFSVAIFVSGIFEIAFSISNKKVVNSWGWYLATGIIDLIIGIYLLFYPLVSMELIPLIVAFWLLFRGFTICGYATDLKRFGTKDWGWYMAFGILAVLCSLAIIWQPGIGAISILYIMAIVFLIIGLFRILLAFELKSLHKKE